MFMFLCISLNKYRKKMLREHKNIKHVEITIIYILFVECTERGNSFCDLDEE